MMQRAYLAMHRAAPRRAHQAMNILAVLLSASCASSSSSDHHAQSESPPPPPMPSAAATDPSYDSQVLVVAPVGML